MNRFNPFDDKAAASANNRDSKPKETTDAETIDLAESLMRDNYNLQEIANSVREKMEHEDNKE